MGSDERLLLGFGTETLRTALLGVSLLLAGHAVYWLAVVKGVWPPGFDFSHAYYSSAVEGLAGQNAYRPYGYGGLLYHTTGLLVVGTVAWLPEPVAFAVWTVQNSALWLVSVALAVSLVERYRVVQFPRRQKLLLIGLFGMFAPAAEMLYAGQINAVPLVCILGSIFLLERGHRASSGVTLAVAIGSKVSPVVLLGYLVQRREYLSTVTAMFALGVLTLLAEAVFYLGVTADFLQSMWALITSTPPVQPTNQSLVSVVVGSGNLLGYQFKGDAITVVSLLHKALIGVPLGLVILYGWRRDGSTLRCTGQKLAVFLTAMVVASPLIWFHHSVFLVFPLLFLVCSRDRTEQILGLAGAGLIQASRAFEHLGSLVAGAHGGALVVVVHYTIFYYLVLSYLPVPTVWRGVGHRRVSHTDGEE